MPKPPSWMSDSAAQAAYHQNWLTIFGGDEVPPYTSHGMALNEEKKSQAIAHLGANAASRKRLELVRRRKLMLIACLLFIAFLIPVLLIFFGGDFSPPPTPPGSVKESIEEEQGNGNLKINIKMKAQKQEQAE